ncbi:CLUMA_CG012066, isoform A [Clunio marinus]|uniref:CLUMA_CG012066, isoform A n=1 Tax=Clunio marinus TaxID=568069 RepID=A0A1J1IFT1_9DIPT|nr:CLUMA_CG012066, isoform A [Clunio marinus]
MKECCSHQEEAIGDLFKTLINNYIPFWIIFSISCFAIVIIRFIWKKKTDDVGDVGNNFSKKLKEN